MDSSVGHLAPRFSLELSICGFRPGPERADMVLLHIFFLFSVLCD